MPRFFAYFSRSRWHSLKLGLCQGRTAPARRVLVASGTTSPKSTPITRPKPRQVSQAPSGELKENAAGVASEDRKSTRLNSSHTVISYAVFCLKKKNTRDCASVRRGILGI